MNVEGAVVLVTGAASGLGAAVAERLHDRGALVVGVDLAFKGEPAWAVRGRAVVADITKPHNVERAVLAAGELGALRGLVNCAGVALPPMRVVDRKGRPHPLDSWRQVIEVNLIAAFDLTRQAASAMALHPCDDEVRGVIVHVSSIAGIDGPQGATAYATAKGALVPFVQSAARDLSVWGIRCMAVAPGTFATPMYERIPPEQRALRDQGTVYPPRAGRPEEFAALVEHVIANDYLNADCLRLDAGMRILD